ncbi:MAG: class I SAM-dependent methyltransferase [Actinobacteria bacterium]|nr:class I SAM-dependent methyltransferase [Actinomycetota bacterium]
MTQSLQEQYATDDNLQARIALHAAFSINPHWAEWLFEQEAPAPGARILDLGCGPATFWRAIKDRIDPSWFIPLADLTPGMVAAARRELGARAVYVVADAQDLPFPADSFDAVLANHMLYHVPDRPRAFAEISRVLVSGGTLHASTIGHGYLAELVALAPHMNAERYSESFGLETGPRQLEPFFTDIHVERFQDALAVTDVEPVLAYLRSSESYNGQDPSRARTTVQNAIARDGAFRVAKPLGVVSCRKA